jgi:hypothetical protein
MNTTIVAGSLLTALALVAPLHGQQVAADVVVRSGPVAGRVVIGDGYSTYRRPVVVYRRAPERVIVVERAAPRVVVIEQVHRRHGRHANRHANQWRKHGYHAVTVFYRDGRYYDRHVRGWPEMREVVVYERDGRYYRPCDGDRDWDDRSYRDGRDGRDWDD